MKHLTTAGLLLLATPAALAAQGDGGGGALFDVNLGLSLWTVVVFLLLLFVLGKFAWGPILSAAEARERTIQGALDEARRQHEEARQLLEEHRAQLADARRQSQEIVAEGKAAGERVRKDIEEKARSEGQQIVERARQEIEREKDAAIDAIRKESVDIAMAAAAKLIHERLDSQKDRELVTQYVDRLVERRDSVPGAEA
ncbi:MAG: F0F1 ATP synthase subunit B [Gemmatimonadetes bacterium]|nr:F0F1 ATP synthase subunit B [Gemmatimonadota bacterium]